MVKIGQFSETLRQNDGHFSVMCDIFHLMEGTDTPVIFCVDDEESIRETLAFSLRKEGYIIETFADGSAAWERVKQKLPDLAIMDIMMPKMDGLELCRKIRQISEQLPIVFLTSKDEEIDRVLGLELGADDYLCKPFSMRELIARIKVIFRRIESYQSADTSRKGAESPSITAGPLHLNTDTFTVTWRTAPVPVTVTEFRILASLAEEPGKVKNRDQLLASAYPEDLYVSDRAVDSHIKRIRKKIQAVDAGFDSIDAIYGLGYKFTLPEYRQ